MRSYRLTFTRDINFAELHVVLEQSKSEGAAWTAHNQPLQQVMTLLAARDDHDLERLKYNTRFVTFKKRLALKQQIEASKDFLFALVQFSLMLTNTAISRTQLRVAEYTPLHNLMIECYITLIDSIVLRTPTGSQTKQLLALVNCLRDIYLQPQELAQVGKLQRLLRKLPYNPIFGDVVIAVAVVAVATLLMASLLLPPVFAIMAVMPLFLTLHGLRHAGKKMFYPENDFFHQGIRLDQPAYAGTLAAKLGLLGQLSKRVQAAEPLPLPPEEQSLLSELQNSQQYVA